jgi:hypothetical protein
MTQRADARADVEVGVDINNGDVALGSYVSKVMSVSRLVPASKDDRDCTCLQHTRDHFREGLLGLLQVADEAHVPGV